MFHELKIREFLKEKFHHDNYKEIRKDVAKVEEMLSKAYALEIELDDKLVHEVNSFISRLQQERDMRKSRDLMIQKAIKTCEHSDVAKLTNLVDKAKENKVEDVYISASEKLLG